MKERVNREQEYRGVNIHYILPLEMGRVRSGPGFDVLQPGPDKNRTQPGPDYINYVALEMHCSAQNMTENFWQIVLVKFYQML